MGRTKRRFPAARTPGGRLRRAVGLGRRLLVGVGLFGGCAHSLHAQSPDVALSASGTPSPATAGASLTYSITVTVPAGGATGVTVTDILPGGVTYVSGTPSCSNNQGTITCFLGTLGAGTATASVVVTPTAAGTIKNVVGVIANENDPNMANNSAIVTTTVSGVACGITSIAPNVGPITGGQSVVITGTCFIGATNVVFQSAFATPAWHVDSDTQISATTPGLPIGYGPVNVSVVKGTTATYTLSNGYTYSRWTFTDDPIVAGMTKVKAVHITEIRQDVDTLRARVGLGAAPWRDAIVAGGIVKAIHIQDLRTYLNDALTRLGYAAKVYTDPGLTNGTVIKKIHIDELRQGVRTVPN